MGKRSDKNLSKNKLLVKIFLFAVILTIFILGVFYITNGVKTQSTTTEYEVLDENVISTDIMKRWLDENSKSKGVYITSDNEFTYALISYGETTTPNIGICLENITFDKSINIEYSIISNNSENEIKSYTPKMILRFKGKNIKIKCNEINPS